MSAAGTARGARATGRGMRALGRTFRRSTHARGAGESGLAQLIELHVVSAAGDAIVAVGLAGTLFFSVPLGEARGRVALYLVLTMAPFALMAPVIGPVLDRWRRGRRWAIATTLLLRAFLVVVMAEAVSGGKQGIELYPAAFGCLVASKAYNLTRAAATPRVLPQNHTLVAANARLNLASLITAAVAGGIAAGVAALLGTAWLLRFGMLAFAFGALLAVQLPARVDVPDEDEQGEDAASALTVPLRLPTAAGHRHRRPLPPSVVMALRGNSALRGLSGFLTIYLAFVLRTQPIGGLPTTTALAVIVGGAGLGSVLGTAAGSRLRARAPEPLVVAMLVLAVVTSALAALAYGVLTVAAVATAAGLAQSLAKLALDALIQHRVHETVRTSAFARSETMLQLAWVLGGVLGIVLPTRGSIGLGVIAGLLGIVLLSMVAARVGRLREQRVGQPAHPR